MVTWQKSQGRRHLLVDGCPITPADRDEVRCKRQAMSAGGYVPLAVHTPWSRACPHEAAGKMPVTEVVDGERRSWTRGHSPKRLLDVTALSANTGTRLGGAHSPIALDLDPAKSASPAEQSAYTTDVLCLLRADPAWQQLRKAPMRLREPASLLLLLRANEPITKLRCEGERGAVELLGEGQQCLVDGWHPRSLAGAPVRWTWRRGRAPWTVPVADLPVIPAMVLTMLMERIKASGVLGAPRSRRTTAPASRPGCARATAYSATERLRALFDKHDDLVRPAVRELIAQIGEEGAGRHDAIVAICGRIVLQRWADQQALDFLLPLINESFGDGDWTREIEAAMAHARRRDNERLGKLRSATWR